MGYSRSSVAWELRELVAAAAPQSSVNRRAVEALQDGNPLLSKPFSDERDGSLRILDGLYMG